MGTPVQRNTTIRDRHRKAIARTKPPCALCGDPIDYTLRYPDPMSYVVDHIVPVIKGGADALENKAAAHAGCNWEKYDKLPDLPVTVDFVTSRSW